MTKTTTDPVTDYLAPSRYRLVSVDRACAPEGATGDDWLVYRISQGANVVTGYRRGGREDVDVAVTLMIEALNARLLVTSRPNRSARSSSRRLKKQSG
jgi:hypothetical protein